MNPNLNEERKLWKKGYKRVACLDESGRGPLCGPVVAAAVCLSSWKRLRKWLRKRLRLNLNIPIRDSKKLSAKRREEFYKVLTKHPAIKWGTGVVSEKVIDRINILEATKLAMKRAIKNLKLKTLNFKLDFLILDGKMSLDLPMPQKSIVKADEKVFSCACASILAKVWRDRIMMRYHKKYPRYGFDKHKGYPTKYHLKMLKKYSPCKIHRKSFGPVNKILKIKNQKLKT